MKGFNKRSKLVDFTLADSFSEDSFMKSKIEVNSDGTKERKSIADFVAACKTDEDKNQAMDGIRAASLAEASVLYGAMNGTERMKRHGGEGRATSVSGYIKNALNAGTFGSIFTPVVEMFMYDYIQPRMVASQFLAVTVPVNPQLNKSVISMLRSFGLVKIKEVARGGNLPILNPNIADYTDQVAWDVKRWGAKIEMEKDFMNSDEFGILGFLLTQVADSFRYRKETEVLKVINNVGEVMYDNATPANGTFKVATSGRNRAGAFNGTVTLQDLLRIFAYANMRGVTPTTIVVHPYVLFNMVGDNELSKVLGVSEMINGMQRSAFEPGWDAPYGDRGHQMRYYGGTQTVNTPTGTVPYAGKIGLGPLGKLGIDTFYEGSNFNGAYFMGRANIPGANITVVALPQVPLKEVTVNAADAGGVIPRFASNIYIVGDKKPVGILQESNPTVMEWDDPEKELDFMGFVEKYTCIPLFQGRGVYTIKNVVIDRNYDNFVGQYDTPNAVDEPGTNAPVIA